MKKLLYLLLLQLLVVSQSVAQEYVTFSDPSPRVGCANTTHNVSVTVTNTSIYALPAGLAIAINASFYDPIANSTLHTYSTSYTEGITLGGTVTIVIPDVPFENPNVYQVTTSAAASITIPIPPFSISFNNSNISTYDVVAYETLSLSESPPGTLTLGSFDLMDNQVKYYRNTTEVVTTGASYTPTLSGDYTAKLYNSASGCLSSAFSTTISLTVTSIFEAKGYQFSVFPNPVASSLTIRSEFTKALTYQLSNSKGELVTEQNFNGSTSIDVSHYTSGNYFLSIKDGSTISATYKILVE